MSEEELERLALLAEECAEVIVAVGKILRHGYQSYNPFHSELGSNKEQLEAEIADVWYAVNLMLGCGDVDIDEINHHLELAAKSKPKYLHYQKRDMLDSLKEKVK